MRKSFLKPPYAALLAALTVLSSCLKSEYETTYEGISDCAVTAFTLGSLVQQVNDTTTATYDGSSYAFSIDVYKRLIYNKDSLLYGTRMDSVVCNIVAMNGGSFQKRNADGTFTYFASGDTLNFMSGSRQMRVISPDATNAAVYTININKHLEREKEMTWYAPLEISALTGGQKAFADSALAKSETIAGVYTVIGTVNGKRYAVDKNTDSLYSISADNQPVREELLAGTVLPHSDFSIAATPSTRKTATIITAKAADGRRIALYKAENGSDKWMNVANEYKAAIPDSVTAKIAGYGKYLVAFTDNTDSKGNVTHDFYISEDNARSWHRKYFFSATGRLAGEKTTGFARDKDYILWIFTETGKAYRCKQNYEAWGK